MVDFRIQGYWHTHYFTVHPDSLATDLKCAYFECITGSYMPLHTDPVINQYPCTVVVRQRT